MNIMRHFLYVLEHAHTEASSAQLALGITWGFLLGWIPMLTLHWVMLFFMLVIIRMNLLTCLISYLFFMPLGYLLEPQFESFGMYVLVQAASLREIWAWMYHAPILPYTNFNNTVVAASTFTALFIAPVLYFGSLMLLHHYRPRMERWFWDSALWRTWLNSSARRYYEYYRQNK